MTDSEILIREATETDITTIIGFNLAMALETEELALDPRTAEEGVRRAFADPSLATYYLARSGKAVVGQTMITKEWSDWRSGVFWWIQSVYVDPAFRRRGVFRSLYEHIRNLARNTTGVCGLRLYVFEENRSALETYRNLGMAVTRYKLCEDDWSS